MLSEAGMATGKLSEKGIVWRPTLSSETAIDPFSSTDILWSEMSRGENGLSTS